MGFNGIQQDLLRFSEIYWDFVALITGFIDGFPCDLSDFVGFDGRWHSMGLMSTLD